MPYGIHWSFFSLSSVYVSFYRQHFALCVSNSLLTIKPFRINYNTIFFSLPMLSFDMAYFCFSLHIFSPLLPNNIGEQFE